MRLSAVWLLAVALPVLPMSAQTKQSVSLHISDPVKVGAATLKPGNYKFEWIASSGPTDVTVTGQSDKMTLKANAAAVNYNYQSVETAGQGTDKQLVGFVAKRTEFRFDGAEVAASH